MAKRLLSLAGVSREEADEIRNLLIDNHLSFYETPKGNWGQSMAAIWIEEDSDLNNAKKILDEFYKNREVKAGDIEKELKNKNTQIKESIKDQPVSFIIFILIAMSIVAAMFYAVIQAF